MGRIIGCSGRRHVLHVLIRWRDSGALMFKRFIATLAVVWFLAPLPAAQHTNGHLDTTMAAQIRQEEEQHSQIMRTLHFLTDVYGPRLTGSPSLKAAGEWAIKTMDSWGLVNGHLEPWDFGHP